MLSRARKLTTVGLPLRDELLIRSLVQVIGTKTVDEWTFQESFDADVALCNPNSNLSGVALRRAEQSGAMTCVSVVHDGDAPLPGTRVLHAPIKSTEFITLLNDISHSVGQVRHAEPEHAAETHDGHSLAEALHDLMRTKSADIHAVERPGAAIFVAPAARALYALALPTEAQMQEWLGARDVRVRRVDELTARRIAGNSEDRHDLDALLWRVGLEGTAGAPLHGLPAGATFKLKRWPDFGRLKHQAFHFRMAALLSRGAYTIEALAAASGHDRGETCAFVNACAMCDLLLVDAPAAAEPPRPAPRVQRRYSAILSSIRSALGLRS